MITLTNSLTGQVINCEDASHAIREMLDRLCRDCIAASAEQNTPAALLDFLATPCGAVYECDPEPEYPTRQ